jgi:diguanylate cyclase (GGDEF)-like protein
LYNRRGFIEHAGKMLSLAVRRGNHACLFFADLNAMKAINDTLGHEAGDRALIAAAAVLSAVFRDADVIARLGGDEFAVLASDCGAGDIPSVNARIGARVDTYNAGRGEAFGLSMSIGAEVFDPLAPVELEALISAADARMYEHKVATSDVAPRSRPRSGPLQEDDDERKVM